MSKVFLSVIWISLVLICYCDAQTFSKLKLICSSNGRQLEEFLPGQQNVLVPSLLPPFNLQVFTQPPIIGSVVFVDNFVSFDGSSQNSQTFIDDRFPYLLGCCSKTIPFDSLTLSEGNHTLTISLTNNTNGQGNVGDVVVIFFQVLSTFAHIPIESGWNEIVNLYSFQVPNQIYNYLYPLSEMVKYTYLPAYYDLLRSPPGWTRSSLQKNPSADGIHALVFEDIFYQTTHRLVVAFRGTSSIYDTCADAFLWPAFYTNNTQLLATCENLTNSGANFDYFSQAKLFFEGIKYVYPDAQILFSGHSLGGGLALLMGLNTKSPTLAFSGVGISDILAIQDYIQYPFTLQIYNFADQYDPVYVSTMETQVGQVCLWKHDISPSCASCYSPNPANNSCSNCFSETHLYFHILNLVESKQLAECSLQPNSFNGRNSPQIFTNNSLDSSQMILFIVLFIFSLIFLLGILGFFIFRKLRKTKYIKFHDEN